MSVARVELLVCDRCGRKDGDVGVQVHTWHTRMTDAAGRLVSEAHGDLCEKCSKELAEWLPRTTGRPKKRRKPQLTDPNTGEPL